MWVYIITAGVGVLGIILWVFYRWERATFRYGKSVTRRKQQERWIKAQKKVHDEQGKREAEAKPVLDRSDREYELRKSDDPDDT